MSEPPILTVKDARFGFGQHVLFDALDVNLHANAKLALVGRNGSGKSSLMKALAGLVELDEGTRMLRPGKYVSYLEQDPDMTGFDALRDYAVSGLPEADAYKVDILADGLGLDLDRGCAVASGGERRRAALIKILAEEPDVMLLDEPTNHLDIQGISWLEDRLSETRSGFVVISHDRAFLRRLTHGVLWLDRGVMRVAPIGFKKFEDWRDKIFEEEDQARHKLNRLIKAEARWAVEGISARRKRNQGRVRRLQALRSERAAQIKRTGPAALSLGTGQKSGRNVLEAIDITKVYGCASVVQNFSFKIARGDRVALVGPNGVGKTTLLKILLGEVEPDHGTIKRGTNLIPIYFDQKRDALDNDASLWTTMTEDKSLGVSGKNDQIMVRGQVRHVVGYLKEFLFDEAQIKGPVSVLSGGEKARLLLAKLMARESNLLVLDEPTNDLDLETLDLLQEVLDEYDGTVLLVSHDRDFIDRVATKTLAFEGAGQITAYAGGWSDYQSQKKTKPSIEVEKKTHKKQKDKLPNESKSEGLSFTQKHRLEALPTEIERLEAEIAKLEAFLSTPDLFNAEPAKFQKASDGLVERQEKLRAAEEEWLELEGLREESEI
ncbi:MAG: ATP-binding cassette domain-containing protein [Pseudomonadota bacterium]